MNGADRQPNERKFGIGDRIFPTAITTTTATGSMSEPTESTEPSGPMRYVEKSQRLIRNFTNSNQHLFRYAAYFLLLGGYHAFLALSLIHNFQKAQTILIVTAVVWVYALYWLITISALNDLLERLLNGMNDVLHSFWSRRIIRLGLYSLLLISLAAFLIIDTANDRSRLVGVIGMFVLMFLLFLFSTNPSKIKWRPVLLGSLYQFVFALLVLRWRWGEQKLSEFTDLVLRFLSYAEFGTQFVYGFVAKPPNICGMDSVFAFSVMQVIIYCGAVVSLLYYYGIIQWALKKMARVVQWTMGTTATESVNACACVFLGMSESPLLIKPYLEKMTASELHAVMTAGFSCIAGSLFAAYISFGACPTYLLSATVMSAPGSLACSKLIYPETEESELKNVDDLELPSGEESNALEAMSNGALAAVEMIVGILANLIAFISLLTLLDAVIGYTGDLMGFSDWSFQLFLGYLFFPLAYIMGATESIDQTLRVAQLMGTKTAVNEFVAYQKLGQMLKDGLLTPKSSMIATYALCGFSNFQSVAIQIGSLGGLAPSRRSLLSSIAFRSLFAGSVACFLTAALAGVLVESPLNCGTAAAVGSCFNVTDAQRLLQSHSNQLLISSTNTHFEL